MHDASQLFISHADQPVAGQEHIDHEQTIFDLDEEGGEEEDSEDVEGPVYAAAVPSSSSTLLTQEAPQSTSACWTASSPGEASMALG